MADPTARLSSVDTLRGVAVLGILVVNIQAFAFVAAARTNPPVQGDLHGVNWWIWLATRVLFDGKFLSMFAMLFGASIALLARRCAQRGVATGPIHYRRMTILLVIGLLHAHLLWYGDWLVPLALSGAVAFLYHDLPPRRLFAAGVAVYSVGSIVSLAVAWGLPRWSPGAAAELASLWSPSADAVAWEVGRYRGGWLQQMAHRIPTALRYETSGLATRALWQMTGLMLVGMALMKLGILAAVRSPAFYAVMAAAGLAAGLPLVVVAVHGSAASGWDVHDYLALYGHLDYWGAPIMSLGWIAGVLFLVRLGWTMPRVAAVGRLALTNYLLQTVICTTIFYGHGLGMFGRVERAGQAGIVAGVSIAQIALSGWWVRHFTYGPAEWVWRCLTYGRRFPLRRRGALALSATDG